MDGQVSSLISEQMAAVALEMNVEVYHAELSGRSLRVEIDRAAGTSARTCAEFARALAARLTGVGQDLGQYGLEVSSPGVERRLYRRDDYRKALGRRVRVRARRSLFEGRLRSAGESGITLETGPGPEPETLDLGYGEISEARIVVSDSELFSRTTEP